MVSLDTLKSLYLKPNCSTTGTGLLSIDRISFSDLLQEKNTHEMIISVITFFKVFDFVR